MAHRVRKETERPVVGINSPRVSVQSYVDSPIRDRLDSYVYTFNRDNPGGGMTTSLLVGALITKFLREKGMLDEDVY